MLDKNMVGLDWSTFFIDENGKEISKKQLLEELKLCDNAEDYYNRGIHYIKPRCFDSYNGDLYLALERVLYRFLVKDTSFALDTLTEEKYLKAQELVLRKQFNSKLLKQLNGKFSYLLLCVKENKFGEILLLDVIREKSVICEEKVNRSFAEIKPVINKITSGIKSFCYLEAENKKHSGYNIFKFDEKSNDFINEEYSYDLNNSLDTHSLVLWDHEGKCLNELFKEKLFPNEKFWEEHIDFSITKFIKSIREYNSDAHANKILSYIFDEIKKDDFANKLIENNLSLIYYYDRKEYLKRMANRTFNFSFGRFGLKKPFLDLLYPITKAEKLEEKLKQGKEVFEEVLYNQIYSLNKETVKSFINNEEVKQSPILKDQKWTLLDVFDSFTFGFHNVDDKKVVKLICSDYFSVENVLNRVYLKSYYLSTIAKDEQDLSYKFFEVFYDLTQAIEKRTGIQTAFQKDKTIREAVFEKLKENLSNYDIKISDKFKSEYIISLLDRKVACFEEAEKFPVLEQLGDAIYGFAVAELLFYNPLYNDRDCNYYELHQAYISADKQVEICKKCGFDKLYLQASTIAHKYEYDKLIDPDKERFSMQQQVDGYFVKEKYLADSFEMIIGVIYKDCGIRTALDFVKKTIIETFPNVFIKEIRDNDEEFFTFSEYDPNRMDTERDYFNKILPGLYAEMEVGHGMINRALAKLALTLCLGTDSVDARNYITYNYSDSVVKDELAKSLYISRSLHEYFYNGVEFVIKKYKEEIINNYKNK